MNLLDDIKSRAISDPVFAALVAARDTVGMAAALSAGRTKPRSHLITERGVISALGPVEGEALLQALYGFGGMTLPDGPLKDAQPGIARVISWLKPPADGVDLGDPLTQQLLGVMAQAGIVKAASVDALFALARTPDPIGEFDVRRAVFADDGTYLPEVA